MTTKATTTKATAAEALSSRWLADGNMHLERGNKRKAELCYAKAEYWLARANKLRGYGDGSP